MGKLETERQGQGFHSEVLSDCKPLSLERFPERATRSPEDTSGDMARFLCPEEMDHRRSPGLKQRCTGAMGRVPPTQVTQATKAKGIGEQYSPAGQRRTEPINMCVQRCDLVLYPKPVK